MRSVIVKGSGGAGLGDKIRGLAVAILYAKLTDRTLYVDWRDTAYGDGSVNYFGLLFELHGLPTTMSMPIADTVQPPAWQGRLHCSFNDIRSLDGAPPWNRGEAVVTYSTDVSRLDYPDEATVIWDFDQFFKLVPAACERFSPWRDACADRIMAEVLRMHLSPVAEIRERVDIFRQQHFAGRFVLGVHVRHTRESAAKRTTPTLRQYLGAVRKALRGHREARIFLATDNVDVPEVFIRHFGAERLIIAEKWFPPAGEPIHMNRACPDGLRSARESLVDLYLLAACNSLITLCNSSFSILAGLFSDAPAANRSVLVGKAPLAVRLARRVQSLLGRLR